MNPVHQDLLDRLRGALPALENGTELILRPSSKRTIALLRPVGSTPRAFEVTAGLPVELLPHKDRKLPAARLFAKASRLSAALEPYLGKTHAPQLVAWRPRRRAVVKVQQEDRTLFVKFLDEKAWRRAEVAFSALGSDAEPLRLARPIAMLPELQAYATQAASGDSLREHLANGTACDWPLVDASLHALAKVEAASSLPRHDFLTARDAAAKMLRKASMLGEHYTELADAIERVRPPEDEAPGFVHGDLHDKQVFLGPDHCTLIDLEGVGYGDTHFDLVNLAEHLRLRALQHDRTDDQTDSQLLDRFHLAPDLRKRWRLAIRARICAVYALRPRWAQLTSRLVEETQQLLEDLE